MKAGTLLVAVASLGLGLMAPAALAEEQSPGAAQVQADRPAARDAVLTTQPAGQVAGVKVGQKAPNFTLKDQEGKEVSLADYKGKIVVLEWVNPECPYVVRHYKEGTMKKLAGKYQDEKVVWLAINTTDTATPKSNKAWIEQHGLEYPILDDSDGKVGRLYGAKTTPHMFVIDKEGTVVYQGGIDDDPRGNKADKTNYVDQALKSVVAGEKVAVSEARPYGCSVKFRQQS